MPDSLRPRIAVVWARSASSHGTGYSAKLGRLAGAALTEVAVAGGGPAAVDSAAGPIDAAAFAGVLVLGGGDIDPRLYGGNHRESTLANICRRADDAELAVIRQAAASGTPVLGICRGMQLINTSFGGTLHEDLGAGSVHRLRVAEQSTSPTAMAAHAVVVTSGTLLAKAFGSGPAARRVTVQSAHHQAVREPGRGLRISAAAPDGVIEAVERQDERAGWLLGVQWHPEGPGTEPGQFRALLDSFLAAAQRHTLSVAGYPG